MGARYYGWATIRRRTESAMSQHYMEKHPDKIDNPRFKVSILDRPTSKSKRLISEALLINQRKPTLNLKYESGQSQNVELYIGLSAQQRDDKTAN